MRDLTSTEVYTLSVLSIGCLAVLFNAWKSDGEPLFASLAISGLAFAFSYATILWTGDVFMSRGYKGRDMAKKTPIEMSVSPTFEQIRAKLTTSRPETMGLICALVYLLAVINFLPFAFKRDIVEVTSGGGNKDRVLEAQDIENGRFLHRFPLEKLASYGFAYGTLASVTILGVLDDSFDMRWRHKFFIPAFAALPLLALYFVDFGVTHVVVPLPLQQYLGGELLDLGWIYYVYMAVVAIFCPNSINILAGINGIEVGQSLVLAFLVILNDMLYVLPSGYPRHPAEDSHLFSIYLLLPFVGVSLSLLKHNWYPAKVFVGDTYCYFSGMVFAVVGILGHFSKTLMLLFIPQVFNFVYSAPQIFKLVPCPRHRLPKFNARTGLLEPSVATFAEEKPLNPAVGEVLKVLHGLKVVRIEVNEKGRVTETSNLTILNLWLVWRGPLREDRLATEILSMQLVVGLAALWVRHSAARLLFGMDNRF